MKTASFALRGQRVVVTRAAGQTAELIEQLCSLGAETIELPAIEFQPPQDWAPLDTAIARLPDYDWIIFTSANGVRFFLERLDASPRDLRSLRARICAIGPATRKALESVHLKADLVPPEYVGESLVQAFGAVELAGKRILLPRAAGARDLVPSELRRRGAVVDVVEAYRTAPPADLAERARRIFRCEPRPHWVTFTSSSTAAHLIEAAGKEAFQGVRIASIGPVTSATVRRYGLEVAAEARVFTSEGLVEAILAAC
ncbi:MAG: uroporphyrinogen-III synthase [Bryobacteraceae bacterium]